MLTPLRRRSAVIPRLAVLVLLLAAGLRFYRIDFQSYWNDEGNTRALVARDGPALLANTAADIHPPGYYLLLKAWRDQIGESEFALRGFSALAGVVLVALLYRLGRAAGAGLAAALLGAVNPFLIYYAQEARMYALLATAGAAAFFLFSELWRASLRSARRPWALIAGFGLATAFGLYLHYAFGFIILAQGAALGLGRSWEALRARGHTRLARPLISNYLLSQALAVSVYLPWLPIAYRQLTGWPAAREFHPFWESLLDLTRYLAFGRTLPTGDGLWGLAAVGALVVLGLGALVRRFGWPGAGQPNPPAASPHLPLSPAPRSLNPYPLIILLWLLVPAGLTLAFGLLTEAFAKFLLVAVPPLCLLLGAALSGAGVVEVGQWTAGRRAWPLMLGRWVLGGGVLFVTYLSLNNLYFNAAYFRDDYRGIARYIAALGRPGDAVITNAPNQAEAFDYYLRSDLPGRPPLFPLPDSRPLDPARTAAQLAEIAARHDRLYVVYWGDAQADPEKFIESWLTANTFTAGSQWFGQVRLATYAAARPAGTPDTASGARFGGAITLAGYTLRAADLAPGDIAQLTLFWRADPAPAERYKVFVHLYADVDAPPVAQQDGEPGGGLAPTTTWAAGQTYADNHGLLIPADLPPGQYQLRLGLYNLATGERLPVAVGDTITGDRLDLGAIVIR